MFSPMWRSPRQSPRSAVMVAGLGGFQLFDIGAGWQRGVGDQLHKTLEVVVAGDEIGLGIDFDNAPLGPAADARRQGLRPPRGRPSWPPWRGLSCAANRPRASTVALGLGECRLAIHHARAGLLAQVLDQRSGDLCHRPCPSEKCGCGGAGLRRGGGPRRRAGYSAFGDEASCLGHPGIDATRKAHFFANLMRSFVLEVCDLPIVEDAQIVELLFDRGATRR